MSGPSGGGGAGGGLRRSATNVYRRLLNFDSPLVAMGLEGVVPKAEEKLLKSSFYQAATMFILAFGGAGVYSLYLILSPFVKPILWAVLIGTVLHPVKLAISHHVRKWLGDIGSNSTVPILSFHVAASPITIIYSLTSYIQSVMTKFVVPLTAASFLIMALCAIVRFNFPVISNYLHVFYSIFDVLGFVWDILTMPWPVYLTAILGYAIAVIILPPSCWPPLLLRVCSIVWWILLSVLVSKMVGPVISMMLVPALALPVFVKYVSNHLKSPSKRKRPTEGNDAPRPSLRSVKLASEFIAALSPRLSSIDVQSALAKGWADNNGPTTDHAPETHVKPANVAIVAVVWAVVLVKLLSHPFLVAFLVPFLMLPPLIRCITKYERAATVWNKIRGVFHAWLESRRTGFVPPIIAKLGRYLVKGDAKIRSLLLSCVEACVTVVLIVGVVALFALTIFIAAVQLHRETVYVFTMSNEILNQTLHPEVNRWLESADMNVTSMHEIASNAANFGRDYFNSTVDGWIRSVPEAAKYKLKLQLLNAYDLMSNKFFETWTKDFGKTLQIGNRFEVASPLEAEADDGSLDSTFFSSEWFYFMRENIASIMEIVNSLWSVLKENAGLLLAILTHILSALLLTSWTLFGYAVSSVVFLTTLYYLLIASGDTYKPVQLLISLTPFDDETSSGSSNIVGRAIDSGIRGVFYATFKMVIFYGLYTWFLHSVFDIGIAFLPSLCAAVLAAVPLVGVYWASLPGVFQLWLIADRRIAALLFFGLHMLPMYFIDALIYGDIKGGGHPYLTGLAIVGGVSCLGFEGAILGPVLLCLIVITMNLYRGVLHRPAAPAAPVGKTTSDGDGIALACSATPATLRRQPAKTASANDLVDSTYSNCSSSSATTTSETSHPPLTNSSSNPIEPLTTEE